jgi:hypothetical protein
VKFKSHQETMTKTVAQYLGNTLLFFNPANEILTKEKVLLMCRSRIHIISPLSNNSFDITASAFDPLEKNPSSNYFEVQVSSKVYLEIKKLMGTQHALSTQTDSDSLLMDMALVLIENDFYKKDDIKEKMNKAFNSQIDT